MFTFLKAQTASLIATIVDFLITVVVKEMFGATYLVATATGNVIGGITNFMLGRGWVFDAENNIMYRQAIKYVLVWMGSIALNTFGVYVFTHYAGLNYMYSKVLASIIVAFSYNYLLQKRYVFR